MKINQSAKCWSCKESMGTPLEVVEEDNEQHTLYECVSCDALWHRPHN